MLRTALRTVASRAARSAVRGGRAATARPLAGDTLGYRPNLELNLLRGRNSVLSSPVLPFSVRGLNSSSAVEKELVKVLKAELKHEKESFEVPEEVSEGPPEPFQVDDKVGSGVLVLRRSYDGEDIAVTVGIQGEEFPPEEGLEGEEDGEVREEDEMIPNLPGTVTVTKGADGAGLEFHVHIDAQNRFGIEQVTLLKEDAADDSESYGGPDFDMLDPAAQAAFHSYLEARGCTEELGGFLRAAVLDKEQREYMRWLEGVVKVVGKA
eukprot:TRINITY_DN33089_c0_g1_i1.p1 TRINITY_DN33089_c0_g1~~TRINITY_DN33089_c0_g1_i1.p1  ORF type:complete len:266 (-),score=66.23 TRINITY_DN33089_c0_g1_i1:524-1321(-)